MCTRTVATLFALPQAYDARHATEWLEYSWMLLMSLDEA